MESRGTAASYRFERGTDPNRMLEGALCRAVGLIAELAGGTPEGAIIDQNPRPREPRIFGVSPARTSSYLGMPVDATTIRDSLTRLSMECSSDSDQVVQVKVPTWRADVNDAVVLIEDVARMIGYDQIPVKPQPSTPTVGLRSTTDQLRQVVSDHLVAAGFFECRNPSLESPKMTGWLGDPGDLIAVRNWATREMSVLRRTLLSGLATTVQTNVRRGAQSAWFFECDRIFGGSAPEAKGSEAMKGRWQIAGVAGGRLQRSNWRADGAQVDFFTLKGTLEDLLEKIGARGAEFRAVDRPPFVAGTAATVVLESRGSIGVIGEIDPKAVEFERVPFRVFAFEIDLEALEAVFKELPVYQPLLRQPAVTRDMAVVVSTGVFYQDLEGLIRATAGDTLELLRLVDRYQGAPVPAGHQSLAFHMHFRHVDRTLTANEIAEIMEQVTAVLKERFGAELRGETK